MNALDIFTDIYEKQISILNNLPGNSKYKEYATLNLQQAFHWTRELLLSNEENAHPLCGSLGGGL